VLIVGCGFPQLGLIRTAKALGLHVIGLDFNPRAVAVPLVDEFHEVSTSDVDGIAGVALTARADGVTTTGSEVSLKATAAACARTGHAFYASPEIVRRCQDKDAMRAGYAAAGLRVPRFVPCSIVAQALAFARDVGFPLVAKPARGWGQRGVARADSEAELEAAVREACARSAEAGLDACVIEEWIEGAEYSVNGWIEDGRLVSYCVTERLTVPGKKPLGVMIAEVTGSGLSAAHEAIVVDEARRGAAALGHERGPCYSQVLFDPKRGACLLETAARMGGGFDADVTRLASGVDLYQRTLGIALGRADWEAVGVTGPQHGGAIAKFLIGPPGVLREVSGLDEARAAPGVEDAAVFVPVGGTIHPLTDAAKRAGYVLARGEDRRAAEAAADAALAAIHLRVEGT
jgi:biotin carboxylase